MKRWLPRGAFGKGVSAFAGGAVLGQLVTVASAPVLVRFYTPQDFGLLGIYASVLGILGAAVTLRFDMAIPLADDRRAAGNLALLGASATVMLATLTALAAYPIGRPLLRRLGMDALTPHLWLLPVGLLGVGLYQTLSYWAIREKAYGIVARTKISQAVGQAASQLALGLAQVGPLGLLVGHVVGVSSGVLSLSLRFAAGLRSAVRSATPAGLLRLAGQYRRFPLYLAPAELINTSGRNLPTLLLASFYGTHVAGVFFLADRVVGLPLTLIGNAVSQVFYADAGEIARRDPRELRRLVLDLARNLFLAALGPALLLLAFGEASFALVFGEEWRISGTYASALAVMLLVRFVASPLAVTLTVLGRQPWMLAVQTALVIGSGGALAAGHLAGFGPTATIRLYASVMSLVYAGVFLSVVVTLREAVALDAPRVGREIVSRPASGTAGFGGGA